VQRANQRSIYRHFAPPRLTWRDPTTRTLAFQHYSISGKRPDLLIG
jgi:hypothetical protein